MHHCPGYGGFSFYQCPNDILPTTRRVTGERRMEVNHIVFIKLDSHTIREHSEKVSTMETPIGDNLQHRTPIFGFSILRVSMATARVKMTFLDVASLPDAGHLVNKKPLCQEVIHWD